MVNPNSAPPAEVVSTPQGEYPSTPEGVVHTFLTIYADNPANAIQYLAPDFVAGLDETRVNNLLQLPGIVEGYVMLEGAGSAVSERSEILVAISSQKNTYRRLFLLVIRNGLWQIEDIQQVKN